MADHLPPAPCPPIPIAPSPDSRHPLTVNPPSAQQPKIPTPAAQSEQSLPGNPSLAQPKKSFAAALSAQSGPCFPKLSFPSRNKVLRNGKPLVLFSPAEIKAGIAQMQFTLIAKFSAGKLKSEEIKRHIQSSWKLSGPFSTGSLDGRHELINLNSEADLIQAFACPTHQIGGFLFRLYRWSPDFSLKKESAKAAVWIRIPDLSLNLFNEGFLKLIGDSIGSFLKVDERTLARTCPAYARVLIEIDLKSPLVREFDVGSTDGEEESYEIIYEGRLGYCNKCNKQGHTLADCRRVKKQSIPKTPPPPPGGAQPIANEIKGDWKTVQKQKVSFPANQNYMPVIEDLIRPPPPRIQSRRTEPFSRAPDVEPTSRPAPEQPLQAKVNSQPVSVRPETKGPSAERKEHKISSGQVTHHQGRVKGFRMDSGRGVTKKRPYTVSDDELLRISDYYAALAFDNEEEAGEEEDNISEVPETPVENQPAPEPGEASSNHSGGSRLKRPQGRIMIRKLMETLRAKELKNPPQQKF